MADASAAFDRETQSANANGRLLQRARLNTNPLQDSPSFHDTNGHRMIGGRDSRLGRYVPSRLVVVSGTVIGRHFEAMISFCSNGLPWESAFSRAGFMSLSRTLRIGSRQPFSAITWRCLKKLRLVSALAAHPGVKQSR